MRNWKRIASWVGIGCTACTRPCTSSLRARPRNMRTIRCRRIIRIFLAGSRCWIICGITRKSFNLLDKFNTKVVMALPLPDGRWELELASGEKRIYKGLIVCNGHHWDRRFPNYPGKFEGAFIHSKDYRTPAELAGKRVLVIGGGNSACDIAAEAARVGKTARISLRRGYWFLPKTLFGVPSPELIKPWFPVWAQRIFLRLFLRVAVGKYSDYGLPEPDHKIFEAHPTINSELLY